MIFKANMSFKKINSTRINYKKIFYQNTLWNIVLFFFPFFLLFFLINLGVSPIIKSQILNRLADTVEENVKTVQTFIQDREADLYSYTRLEISSLEEVSAFLPIFESLLKRKKWYKFMFICDLDGNIVFSIGKKISGSVSQREYFQKSKQGYPYISGIFISDLIHEPVLIISQPLYNKQNRIIGVLSASLELESFYDLLFQLPKSKTNEIFLVNTEGLLLSPTKLGGKPLFDLGHSRQEKNPHTGDRDIKTHLDYRGQKVLCAYQKIPRLNFYVVSEIDLKEGMLPLQKVNRTLIIVFLPFFVLSLIVSSFHSKRIVSLLQKLTSDLHSALKDAQLKKKEIEKINRILEEKISESKLLTEEVRKSENFIRNLIDSLSVILIGISPKMEITHFNKQAQLQFNLNQKVLGKNIFESIPPLAQNEIKLAFERILRTHQAQNIDSISFPSPDENYFRLSLFPIIDSSQKLTGITLLIEDITQKKKLQEQLAEYEKLSALSQLALGAAHEINNPLQGISSYLEILKEKFHQSTEKEELDLVISNVYRISETIRGLLNFARPSPPQFTKVNLNSLIEDTLSFLRYQPIFRKINIQKHLSSSLPLISADLNLIRQVLINIIINAAQAMPEGGDLIVKTSKLKFKEWISIEITDTGSGIPPEHLKKIFHPFFTTKKKEGTGLGLSISLSYIRNHKGNITIKSKVGEGTTVTILLPIRQKKIPSS
ncbi:MAG: PAS domain S-box protein [Candidatus Aminicenantes bacterium]|nr:PAS domain S-box protein [Candidatus Aminicenantes bacterium]